MQELLLKCTKGVSFRLKRGYIKTVCINNNQLK